MALTHDRAPLAAQFADQWSGGYSHGRCRTGGGLDEVPRRGLDRGGADPDNSAVVYRDQPSLRAC